MSKILVIGGSGFLGSHVADELSNRNHEVYIYDRTESKYLKSNQNMIVGDILDQNLINESVNEMDYVYHFAAMADINDTRENPTEAVKYNILATMYILKACVDFKVKRFIFSSSIYVYSKHGSFYRSTKQACELFIENFKDEFNLDFTILRYGSLYGPRANDFNFIRNSIKEALLHGVIKRKGDGNEVRDYINVIDAANSSSDILLDKYKNTYVMVTGNKSIKVKELLTMIKEIFNDKIEIKYLDDNYAGHYQLTPYTFKPNIALKIISEKYHDLGQGILDCIHKEFEELNKNGDKTINW